MALDMHPEDVVVLALDELALRVLADARRTNGYVSVGFTANGKPDRRHVSTKNRDVDRA
ncbi:hypothetical protein [Blastococcus saxobsidens]|uniref:hypothetical protein n=1 Tax=Blastococcus saxobsidens TaxID=138336 RepID=UPI0003122657|nr:hypothetical protein [Blastococcus saxobsidens]